MDFLLNWLGAFAFAALILALLLWNLLRHPGALARILIFYFLVCLVLLVVKWGFRLDLATYDAEKYHDLAVQIATLLRADFWGNLPLILKPYAAYTLPLGLVYFVFGAFEPVGQLLNVVVGLGVIIHLHQLSARWFGARTADRTALFMALYPYGWILSCTLNRDLMIAYCLILFFRVLADLQDRELKGARHGLYLTALASFIYMGLLRPPLLVLGAVPVFVYVMTPSSHAPFTNRLFRVVKVVFVLSVIGVGSLGYLLYGKYYMATSRLEQEATQFSNVDNMNQRLRISEEARSAYMTGVKYSSYLDVIRVMPEATGYFLFSPLPWQVQSPKQILGLLDSFWLLGVCWYFCKGIKGLVRRNRKLAMSLLAFLAVGICTSAVLQANVGSAMRHRTMFYFLMFPVAVQGLRLARCRRVQGGTVLPARKPRGRVASALGPSQV